MGPPDGLYSIDISSRATSPALRGLPPVAYLHSWRRARYAVLLT